MPSCVKYPLACIIVLLHSKNFNNWLLLLRHKTCTRTSNTPPSCHALEFVTPRCKTLTAQTHRDAWDPKMGLISFPEVFTVTWPATGKKERILRANWDVCILVCLFHKQLLSLSYSSSCKPVKTSKVHISPSSLSTSAQLKQQAFPGRLQAIENQKTVASTLASRFHFRVHCSDTKW